MKKILTILFVLLISHSIFSQTEAYKFSEFDTLGDGGCGENFRMFEFADELKKNPKSKGLIIVYFNDHDSKERFGNIWAYSKGAKEYLLKWLGIQSEKFEITIAKGEKSFSHEFWIIPENGTLPVFEPYSFDWVDLKEKYYFSETCFQCEPTAPLLTGFQGGFEEFSGILKQFPHYKGQILVNNYSELLQIRNILTKDNKLPRNRYSIHIRKQRNDEEPAISIDLYLIPKKTKLE